MLALAFSGFGPAKDDLKSMIGSRSGRGAAQGRDERATCSLSCYRPGADGPLGRRLGF